MASLQVPATETCSIDPRTAQRERMLDLAETILEREGPDALQARRIAREAQCSVGTLYNLFRDLDDLVLQLNERTLRHLVDEIAASLAPLGEASLEMRVDAVATGYLRFALAHTARWRALSFYRFSDGALTPASLRHQQALLRQQVETPLASFVADELARRRIARAILAAIHGAVVCALDCQLDDYDADETRGQIAFLVAALAGHVAGERGT